MDKTTYWTQVSEYMEFNEFACLVSNFHKDCFGFRPNLHTKAEYLQTAINCSNWLRSMEETNPQALEDDGWIL